MGWKYIHFLLLSAKKKKEWKKSSWKEHSDQRWGERTCVTEMENDERITLVSRMRIMRKSPNIFSLLFQADTRTYLAQPDGYAYVDCNTCETLLYVPSPCGFRITKSRQFRQYKNIYAQSLVVNYMECHMTCVAKIYVRATIKSTWSCLMYWIVFLPPPLAAMMLYSMEIVIRFWILKKGEMSAPGSSVPELFLI